MGRGIADAHRDRFEDEVHRPVPSVGRDFVDRGAVAACGGIVEHDVDAAAALRSFVHQRFDVRRDGDVAPDEFDPAVRRRGKRLTASSMSAAKTWAPSPASFRTAALPIPDAAPVTTATLPANRISCSPVFFCHSA
jgi:hypothetical protein